MAAAGPESGAETPPPPTAAADAPPPSPSPPQPEDLDEVVRAWLRQLDDALRQQQQSGAAAAALFREDECFWRDVAAVTWNIYTAESRAQIADMVQAIVAAGVQPGGWALDGPAGAGELELDDATGTAVAHPVVQACVRFETAAARGRGFLRLVKEEGSGSAEGAAEYRCWTLLTAVTELKGHEEPPRDYPDQEAAFEERYRHLRSPAAFAAAKQDQEEGEDSELQQQPYCVVVGGGQSGLAVAARLRRLRVPTVVLDRLPTPGDAWRRRYSSLRLHDPVWFDHMPYLPFPPHWPVFSSKDRIADWLQAYAAAMAVRVWGSCDCRAMRWSPDDRRWHLQVSIAAADAAGHKQQEQVIITLRPVHVVMATGLYGAPTVPAIPGADTFQGGIHCHSSRYDTPEAPVPDSAVAGKQCVVVGSNTSAHDICADLHARGAASVTMVQRSPTLVVRAATIVASLAVLYSDSGPPTATADLLVASLPYALVARAHAPGYRRMAALDAPLLTRLRAAGFLLAVPGFGDPAHPDPDAGAGLLAKFLRRGTGYYIDVGASELLAAGAVGVRAGVGVAALRPRAVVLSDGSEVPADVLVYATGYDRITLPTGEKDEEEEERDEEKYRCWGMGSGARGDPGPWVGELRNMWKPTAVEGVWVHGGNLALSRFYSLPLALQIKARFEGLPTPVYRGKSQG